jgi:hypothetical protein
MGRDQGHPRVAEVYVTKRTKAAPTAADETVEPEVPAAVESDAAVAGEVVDAAPATKNVTPGADTALVATESTTVSNVSLKRIANGIRKEWGRGIDAQFAIGRLLGQARAAFPADKEYGHWLKEQAFPFTYQTAWNLRMGAEREDEVRAYIALNASGEQSRDIGVTTAIKELTAKSTASDDDRQPADRVKAVQDLVGPEKESSAFVKFEKAAAALDLTQLADEELVAIAGIVKDLAAAYNAERKVRAERS